MHAAPAVPRVLYIGGTGRSGSTLLEQLLAGRDDVTAVGEIRYLWKRGLIEDQLCSCGVPVRSCSFWTEVLTRALGEVPSVEAAAAIQAEATAVDRLRYVPGLVWPRLRSRGRSALLVRHGERLRAVYAAVAATTGAAVVVDSSKDPSYAYLLSAIPSIDVVVAHLVRDSRAVAHSWTRRRIRPEIHWRTEHMRQLRPSRSAAAWLSDNVLFELLHRTDVTSTRLRYEDLAREPSSEAERVLLLAGVDGSDSGRDVSRHSVSGNPSRFEGGTPTIAVDDEWRRALAPKQRRIVTAMTAPLLLAYRYLPERSRVR